MTSLKPPINLHITILRSQEAFSFKTGFTTLTKIQGIAAENVNLSEYEQRGETWKKFYESMDPQDKTQKFFSQSFYRLIVSNNITYVSSPCESL